MLVSSYQAGGRIDAADRSEDSSALDFAKIDFLYTVAKTGEMVETAFAFGRWERRWRARAERQRRWLLRSSRLHWSPWAVSSAGRAGDS